VKNMVEFNQNQVVDVSFGVEMTGGVAGTICGLLNIGGHEITAQFNAPAYGSTSFSFGNVMLDLQPGSYSVKVTLSTVLGELLASESGSITIKEVVVPKMALRIVGISIGGTKIYP